MTSGENVYSLVVSGNPKYHLLIYQNKFKKILEKFQIRPNIFLRVNVLGVIFSFSLFLTFRNNDHIPIRGKKVILCKYLHK